MIGRLPHERELANSDALAIAALESWLVHVRLLAEFFRVRPSRDKRDFSARDFESEAVEDPSSHEIHRLWKLASSHLVHLSQERAPEDLFELEPEYLTYWSMVSVSQDLLELAESFVARLEKQKVSVAPQFRSAVQQALADLETKPAE